MQEDRAMIIALGALNWLIANDDLRDIFLGSSGLSPDDLRSSAGEPELLGSVLDFILMDDKWVIACCDAQSLPYEDLQVARFSLPGGEQVHWT